MLIVGLTGGIASGKSTVSELMAQEHGLTIVDADLIARQVVEPGNRAYNSIVSHFQPLVPDLLLSDGKLNRPALGKYVFAHEDERKVLNKLTHPWIRLEMVKQILWAYFSAKRLVILDVPLLFESGLDLICGSTVCVICSEEEQLKRIQQRNVGVSEEEARQRIASQMKTSDKVKKADIVIDNSGTKSQLKDQVNSAVTRLTPGLFMWLITLLPPLGVLSALHTWTVRRVQEKLSQRKDSNKKRD
ncbi:CYFA0S15e01024g1_1 [Cyberlindnera fabianii]|uniref:CYFA0S15e01024g1_1 n=1 Tax=Cyberlindnera fabianii TaxID=36022 RepID=A0A061B401_CYBFA|nr:Dephospho-CoA kinase CAB5 [Cyberlindnera fabianii]CDR44649.1 CYFA0S15e01024g1_1 [Cyberlindnera fabianii]